MSFFRHKCSSFEKEQERAPGAKADWGDTVEIVSGLALMTSFVGYRQALAAFGAATGQHTAAVCGFHA